MENTNQPRWDGISDIKDTSVTIVISSLQTTPNTFTTIGIRRLEGGAIAKEIGNLENLAFGKEFFINKLKPNQNYTLGHYNENNDFIDADDIDSNIDNYIFKTATVIEEQAPILSDLQLRYHGDDNVFLNGNIDHKTSLDVIIHYSVYNEQFEFLATDDIHLSLDNDDYSIGNLLASYSYEEVNYLEVSYSYIDSLGNESELLTDYQTDDANILLPGAVDLLSQEIETSDSPVGYIKLTSVQIGLITAASIGLVLIILVRIFRNKLIGRFFKS